MKPRSLIIEGARQNNLKNLTLHIPHGRYTVVTGPSGSGKSSLAFETIHAEGQRLYVESLSTYARHFLERVQRPDVDNIKNICPTIAIEQRNSVKTSRATVASSTEIYDYLRLLFSKIGGVHCPACKIPIQKESISGIVDFVRDKLARQKIWVIAPFSPDKISVKQLLKKGFTRVLKQGDIVELTPKSDLGKQKEIRVVLDRLLVKEGVETALTDSLETAYQETSGKAIIRDETANFHKFSLDFICSQCDLKFPETLPPFFSFNNPYGACAACKGFGNTLHIDEDLVIPNKNRSLEEGAIEPWTKPSRKRWQKRVLDFARKEGAAIDQPYKQLPADFRKKLFKGTKGFAGIAGFFRKLEKKKYKMAIRVLLSRYKSAFTCNLCEGTRLRPEAEHVTIQGFSISDIHAMTIEKAKKILDHLELSPFDTKVSDEILKQIRSRLTFLSKVGVGYLTLNRLTKTLSGGEAQRVNLANQLGARLMQTLYVLDEPSIGLHPRDNKRLIGLLKQLRDLGNTIIVVEHDPELIRASDYVVELGPQGGEKGGHLIYEGAYEDFLGQSTLTSAYLSGSARIQTPQKRRQAQGPSLKLTGVTHNNLKSVNLSIPLYKLVCVTGISGSGKSSLIHDTLYNALARIFKIKNNPIGRFQTISGFKHLRTVRLLDQKPIGKSPRSNPITYMKAYDEIRHLFAFLPESKKRGYSASTFSFNMRGGRCEFCHGEGSQKIEMHFLADITLTCERCGGKKFKKEVLDVRYNGKHIFDVLSMTVDEAYAFFPATPATRKKLSILKEVGLGYLQIGQAAPTLSGGEAQRLKIAKELAQEMTHTLYLLDEPTTGLHLEDIQKLLAVLNRLVDQSNTVVVIEHQLDLIKSADYVIDLGPEGGHRGGRIIGEGTPEQLAKMPHSYTGKYLKRAL